MKTRPNEFDCGAYFKGAPLPLEIKQVELTIAEAVELVFKILNVERPTKQQRAFAKSEVMHAKENRTFKKLIVVLSGLMDTLEHYMGHQYTLIGDK